MRMSDLDGRSTRVTQDSSVEVQGPDGQWRLLGTLGADGLMELEGWKIPLDPFA